MLTNSLHHYVTFLWLTTIVVHCEFAIAQNSVSFPVTSRQHKRSRECDKFGKSERCFQELWKVDVTAMGNNNCENYERFEHCHSLAKISGCDESDSLHIASGEYLKAQGKMLPPEVFEELKIQLKIKCFSKCDDVFLERQCSHTMRQSDKDRDYAVELEFDGQLRQYRLEMYLASQGCATVRKTMAKWLSFRRRTCGEQAATCLCQKMKERLDSLRCVLTCDQLKQPAPARSVGLLVNSGVNKSRRLRHSSFTIFTLISLFYLLSTTWIVQVKS